MVTFKKKQIVTAILCCGLVPTLANALTYEDAQDLGFMGMTVDNVSIMGAGYVKEGDQLEGSDFFIRNTNIGGTEHDVGLYMQSKNSSFTLTDRLPNSGGDPTFRSSIIYSYTDARKAGTAVKIGDPNFSSRERPTFIGNSVDFFADKTGLEINNGIVDLKNISITALDTAINLDDSMGATSGSKLDLDGFVIKFDKGQFEKIINDKYPVDPTIPGNDTEHFNSDQKTQNGILVKGTGTGTVDQTIVHLKNGEIDTIQNAVSINGAAKATLENIDINTQANVGSSI